jgi:hypothetical protein
MVHKQWAQNVNEYYMMPSAKNPRVFFFHKMVNLTSDTITKKHSESMCTPFCRSAGV